MYSAGPDNPLVGQWNVTGYNNGQAVTSPLANTTVTAIFTAHRSSGSGGCNDYSGSYTLDGTSVTIGPLASTRKACEQEIMDQEMAFFAALQTPATVEQRGAVVNLRDADGATRGHAERAIVRAGPRPHVALHIGAQDFLIGVQSRHPQPSVDV